MMNIHWMLPALALGFAAGCGGPNQPAKKPETPAQPTTQDVKGAADDATDKTDDAAGDVKDKANDATGDVKDNADDMTK